MRLNKFIKDLAASKSYKYCIKLSDSEVALSRAIMKKDGSFPDNSNWDVYELDEGEALPKAMKVGVAVSVIE